MNKDQVEELLYQALETEIGGQEIYKTALRCVQNPDLKEEWQKYLEQTTNHEKVLRQTFDTLSLDTDKQTPGRKVVKHLGDSLVKSMVMSMSEGGSAAEIVAAEAITLAETKDHQNWELLKEIATHSRDERGKAIKKAVSQVEDQEDEHLYHTKGWARELWIETLGMKSVLPPPEEEKDVKSMMEAAKAKEAREKMAKSA